MSFGAAKLALFPRVLTRTGQTGCYDASGYSIPCKSTGQDGELRTGLAWPHPRFRPAGPVVADLLTGLTWTAQANPAGFPLTWGESLDFVRAMNARAEFGFNDWRLPNRRELRSLLSYQTRRPALPESHPFAEVFLGWYWTSTTAALDPAYAWYVHLDGARMFYGRKDQYSLLWPVRGASSVLPATGQRVCYNQAGRVLPLPDPVQDGGNGFGLSWPPLRFVPVPEGGGVLDMLTGLEWRQRASLTEGEVSWSEALDQVAKLNSVLAKADRHWRLPNINELESLVDCARHTPALPEGHPFLDLREVYWSSTTSCFEPDWAWALYLHKGALGVGVKAIRNFHVWPVRNAAARHEAGDHC